ncbi:MAG: hypothetical protein JWN23_1239 [Rhodocyclales bacterium]|nr:hypothetical protein [Rhodocyclales bacterium]
MNSLRACAFSLFCILAPGLASAQANAPAPAQRIRGQIIAFDGTDLQMRSDNGQALKVTLSNDYRVGAVSRGELSKVAPGSYIGVAAMPQPDGTLNAIDIRVFPESMRGTGEGHRPMASAGPGGTMTNATVAEVATPGAATMTNATVSQMTSNDQARRITVKYTSGEKVVLVRPDTPVLMIEPGDKAMLVAGARIAVNVSTQADGSLRGDRITVGLNGAVPPL